MLDFTVPGPGFLHCYRSYQKIAPTVLCALLLQSEALLGSAPSAPVAQSSSNETTTGFTARWSDVGGVTGYFLDVSTDVNFMSILPSFSNMSVISTSQIVTGLVSGTTYYYRVRAFKSGLSGGTSINSNTMTTMTITDAPSTPVVTSVTQSSFTITWNAVPGASSYRLDVSTNNFTSYINGYNGVTVNGVSQTVSGLASGTTYQFRIRGVNISGSSANSSIGSQVTTPPVPTGLTTSSVTPTVFIATWQQGPGSNGATFELEVSYDNFTTLVPKYDPLVTGSTSEGVSGLSPNTVYRWRIRAVNSGGKSEYATSSPIVTLDISGKSNLLALSTPQLTTVPQALTSSVKVSTQVTGGYGVRTVSFVYRRITDPDFTEMRVDPVNSVCEATVTPDMMDELGVEFFFRGVDDLGPIETTHNFTYVSFPSATAPVIPFSSGAYQMFSIPYSLTDKSISSVFDELGGYDKSQWRLFHYQNNRYSEYQEGVTVLEPGKGYWLKSTSNTTVKIGAGEPVKANQSNPFVISLEKGWNQIGNPYPFRISWPAVKNANPSVVLKSLWVYGKSGYLSVDEFEPWTGGFVFSETAGAILVPVTARCSECRVATTDEAPAWKVPLVLNLNGRETVSSFGMDPDAKLSKDRFDEVAVPRFVEYVEMNTHHSDFFMPNFTTDVIPTADHGSWMFTASSSVKEGTGLLQWDLSSLPPATLMLLDIENQTFIDMNTTNKYAFTWKEGKQFKVLYSDDGNVMPGITMVGNGFPNPFVREVTIPFLLDEDNSLIQMKVYDMLGKVVKTITRESVHAGIQTMEWDGQTDDGGASDSGLYFCQLRGDKGVLSSPKRIVKR
jgi:hypothetical protein